MGDDGQGGGVDAPYVPHGLSLLLVRAGDDHHPLVVGRANQDAVCLASIDDLNTDGLVVGRDREGRRSATNSTSVRPIMHLLGEGGGGSQTA